MHYIIKLIIAFLLVLLIKPAIGQNSNVWLFGYKAGIDFNGGTPKAIASEMLSSEGCASICDNDGRLLFYTNGDLVWDADHKLMPNGINLVGLPIASSSSQGALIVPVPESPQQYYVFTIGQFETPYYYGRLFYSIVDMSLNNGMGDVTTKGVFLAANLTEQMTAVAGKDCNIWLLAVARPSGTIKAWNIDENGIDTIPVLSPGIPVTGIMGCIDASPDGTKLAVGLSNVTLFDFNTASGTASNPLVLSPDVNINGVGICFSPDNSKLYVNMGSIVQFDLSLGTPDLILKSKTFINTGFYGIKRGPDGKVYCNYHGNAQNALGVIEQPDLPGLSCQFVKDAFVLLSGTSSGVGLPNVVIKRPAGDTLYTSKEIKAGCFTHQLTLAAEGSGKHYLWDDGSTGSQRLVDKEGIYWLQYRIACNVFIDTFKVSFPNGVLPRIHVRNNCKGQQTGKAWAGTYPGDHVRYHYLWQNSQGDTLSLTDTLHHVPSGDYTLSVTTATCDTILSFFIPEEAHQVSFGADSFVCQGEELDFINTSAPDFTSFQWDLGDGSRSDLKSPSHTYHQSGSYEVTLISIGKVCRDTASKTIVVDSMHAVHFTTQPDRICAGESISFYPLTDKGAIQLVWQFGDGAAMNSGKERLLQHAYATSGVMPVTLKVQFRACPDAYFRDTVYVFALPDVSLGAAFGLCPNNAPVVLKNVATEASGFYRHSWNTGDTTAYLRVTHPGLYSLTVSNEPLGCSNTESVEVTKDCYIDIPNAFSPNGDGINDYFFPRQQLSSGVAAVHFQIRSRWGRLLFETRELSGRGWDGRWNGLEQPAGVYVYHMNVMYEHGRTEMLQGDITLVR